MCILHAVEKVVFIGDYGVNKDPYNHLKHPELKVKKTMAEVPVQRLAPMDKVADWLDTAGLGVNKDPYNHLKHPEPELANDDDKYYYATEFEDEDADEDARIDYLWELLSRWQRLTNIQVEAADAASRAAADATSAIQEAFQHEVRVRVDQRADHVRDNQ
jgi:hypothetical protein